MKSVHGPQRSCPFAVPTQSLDNRHPKGRKTASTLLHRSLFQSPKGHKTASTLLHMSLFQRIPPNFNHPRSACKDSCVCHAALSHQACLYALIMGLVGLSRFRAKTLGSPSQNKDGHAPRKLRFFQQPSHVHSPVLPSTICTYFHPQRTMAFAPRLKDTGGRPNNFNPLQPASCATQPGRSCALLFLPLPNSLHVQPKESALIVKACQSPHESILRLTSQLEASFSVIFVTSQVCKGLPILKPATGFSYRTT